MQAPGWAKAIIVVLVIIVFLAVIEAVGVNPRDYAYLPLLVPVILITALFGFTQGLLAEPSDGGLAFHRFQRPALEFRH